MVRLNASLYREIILAAAEAADVLTADAVYSAVTTTTARIE
jgi:hypothetical protein